MSTPIPLRQRLIDAGHTDEWHVTMLTDDKALAVFVAFLREQAAEYIHEYAVNVDAGGTLSDTVAECMASTARTLAGLADSIEAGEL